jgi:predicted nucleic acid-binding protein
VTSRRRATHVVVDTDVFNWWIDPRPSPRDEELESAIGDRILAASFVTVTEVRFGALRAAWGGLRLRRLLRSLEELDVIQTDDHLLHRCAELRAWAIRAGHPIAQKIHEADRWVAATALVLDLELVAGDGIFENIRGLDLRRIPPA